MSSEDKLALMGGFPVRTAPMPTWPHFTDEHRQVVDEVLKSGKVNYWTGNECREFEKEYAASCGASYAISLANGSVALELALYALGIGAGDEVIAPSRTFIASASCAVARGAVPVVADIDQNTSTICPRSVEENINSRTRAIIAVHYSGMPCDMDALAAIAKRHNLFLIEDCAQAHGATFNGRPVGMLGDISAFSFCQDKIITTGGEGGLLLTNSKEWWERAWSYKDHGKSYDTVYKKLHPAGFRWQHESFGTNWRMTEMQAAIGRVSLRLLPGWVSARRRNAEILREGFATCPGLSWITGDERFDHAYYKFDAFIDPAALKSGWDRQRIVDAVNAEGIPCSAGGCSEIYLEEAFKRAGYGPKDRYKIAHLMADSALMFLVHPTLGEQEMNDTVRAVSKVLGFAGRG